MEPEKRVELVSSIMLRFAERTGLGGPHAAAQRYLWTDAFAVCNFLELHRLTGEERYLDFARRLIDQVHHVLGRHREDDGRSGWLSGLGETEGEEHPTSGGLRIGKKFGERRLEEPFDERLEWERDGQYFHYLTKWMGALKRFTEATGEERYHRWAVELAKAVHAKFTYIASSGGPAMMYWKMSIDLSHPLVASMGHHDPLDGLLTYLELQEGSRVGRSSSLTAEIGEMTGMCAGRDWTTDDPLGLGGLLNDGLRTARLVKDGKRELRPLLEELLQDAAAGLSFYGGRALLRQPAAYRLAFRELGLAIGLQAAARIEALVGREQYNSVDVGDRIVELLREILLHRPLVELVENFWLAAENQMAASWGEHRDINEVMLATGLAPDGYFGMGR